MLVALEVSHAQFNLLVVESGLAVQQVIECLESILSW